MDDELKRARNYLIGLTIVGLALVFALRIDPLMSVFAIGFPNLGVWGFLTTAAPLPGDPESNDERSRRI